MSVGRASYDCSAWLRPYSASGMLAGSDVAAPALLIDSPCRKKLIRVGSAAMLGLLRRRQRGPRE